MTGCKRLPQKIEIIKKYPEDPIFINANKTLFEWAIENLCKNATDAMKGNGKIEFDIVSDDYEVDILIKDYGQGIAKNKINPIFIISEGCKFIKYKSNQRLDPEDVKPKYFTPSNKMKNIILIR